MSVESTDFVLVVKAWLEPADLSLQSVTIVGQTVLSLELCFAE